MRATEKIVAILILALATWAILMMAFTSFQGSQPNRILLVELGSDAAVLNQAVQATGTDGDGIAHNIQMVIRNTHMDFFFIFLYWLVFLSLAYLSGRLGKPFFAALSAACITVAAACDILENTAILAAMRVKVITDSLAVDISEYSEWKWVFFFLATLFLGLAIAVNHHVSPIRRLSGRIFIAAAFCGILGISRNRVSLGFAIWMINLGLLLFTAALLLTLWKLYQSLKGLNHMVDAQHARAHA